MNPNDDLKGLLKEWEAPAPSAALTKRVLGAARDPWWGFFWRGYIRVPVPLACCLGLLMGVGVWRFARTVDGSGHCVASCTNGAKCS
jgi:hypothetical protein